MIDLPQDALNAWRKKAYERFLAIGFPKPKQEAFQYLPLSKLESVWPKTFAPRSTLSKGDIASAILPECETAHLVFVDGYFDSTLSSIPKGLLCLPLDAALKSYGLFLQNRWAKKEEQDPFCLLNYAVHGTGAFLYLPPETVLSQPLQILHVMTGKSIASPRLQVTVGKASELRLVQTVLPLGQVFCNSSIDIALEAEASLHWLDVQLLPADAWAFGALRASLKRGARLQALHATNGAETVRLSAQIELLEENSSALLQGLSMLTGQRQSHLNCLVEHAAPHCQSRQHIKMALNGQSRSSFEGKIFVRPIAQKTEAYQLNNNLLLSDEAAVHTKPNLEILADDVKASHGATVAQLSEEALFYLRSRGLDAPAARTLLLEAFCRELIDTVGIASLKEILLAAMTRMLHG
ncbi:MAG: Fe-S cluster assembly protein SufD [Verrucomicrobiota bacterium]|nr:Fe-S cluster assembly protein SufD [Verrucomicrobiota bacterium]